MKLRSLIGLLPFVAAGCVTVRPVAAPINFIPAKNPELVWVTAHSGEVIPLARPSVRGDTVTGHWLGTADRVSLPLPEIRVIHATQPHRG